MRSKLRFSRPGLEPFSSKLGRNHHTLEMERQASDPVRGRILAQENVAIRAGYYHDPAPTPDKTLNILLPSYTFDGLTLGLGWDLDGLVIHIGGEFLFGKERRSISPSGFMILLTLRPCPASMT